MTRELPDQGEERGPVTQLLREAAKGSEDAAERLFPLVYDELRALAGSCFRGERSDHTLQPTALVHEAWLRLVGADQPDYADKLHFLAIAATNMRRALVDHARGRNAEKRGRDHARVTLSEAMAEAGSEPGLDVEVLDLHEALEELAQLNERHARVVELRYFGGLNLVEIAELLDVSERTARGDWSMARAWLRLRLQDESA